jgi:hypothetical protein
MNAAVMRRALEYARNFDLLFSQHCEDHNLTSGAQMHEGEVSTRLGLTGWPRAAEDIIVARDLILAELTGARYHVAHVSSLGAIRLLREAKGRGLKVSAEVTPHHLALTDESLIGYNTACKVNPPPFKQAEFDIMYAEGISHCGLLVDIGSEANLIEKSGAWYSYNGQRIGQGRENAKLFLKDNPVLTAEIEEKVKVVLGIRAITAPMEQEAVEE